MLVYSARAQSRPDKSGDEFFPQIFHERCACTGCERFFTRTFQILALAQIADHGDHFAAVCCPLQPGNNDGGIEPSGYASTTSCAVSFSSAVSATANFLIEQREQDRFLHVQPVF